MNKRQKKIINSVPSEKELLEAKNASEIMKVKDLVNKQKEYKMAHLHRLLKGAEMDEYRKQIEFKDRIRIKWQGESMPRNILVCYHEIVQAQYFDLIIEENRLKDDLIAMGVTKENLNVLLSQNIYLKVIPDKKVKE